MKSTGQKLILLSFILALIAAVVLFLYFQSLNTPKVTMKKVVVASQDIPARTLIDKKMIKEINVTDDTLFADCIKDSSEIIGKYSKETIMENEGFREGMLLDKNSDDLSIKLEKDHRAVTVYATGASGVADLLKPGDFVDIVVYLNEKKDGDKVLWPDTAKMILQNIEVLAIDQELDREQSQTADGKTSSSSKGKVPASFLITLSINTKDVEELALAENTGSLELALRPIKDDGTIDTEGAAWEELLIDNGSAGSGIGSSGSTTGNVSADGSYTSYTVKHGDTLKKISMAFYGDESKYPIIRDANNIKNENLIVSGEVLKIPTLVQ